MSWPHLAWRWGISFGTLEARQPLTPIQNAKVATLISIVTSKPVFEFVIAGPTRFLWENSAHWRYRQVWTMKQAAKSVVTRYLQPAARWTVRASGAVLAGIGLGAITGLALRETGFWGQEDSESYIAATNFFTGQVGAQEWLSTITEGFIAPITKR